MRNSITIGRDYHCTICVDQRWDTVSNLHAEITQTDNGMTFEDFSSNGTIINNENVHNQIVFIRPGDTILLAGVFNLTWDVILHYFPEKTYYNNVPKQSGRKTIRMSKRPDPNVPVSYPHKNEERPSSREDVSKYHYNVDEREKSSYGEAKKYSQSDIDKVLDKWNWGAFLCTWIWALVHRVYWPLLILLIAPIPYVGLVFVLCVAVYLGMHGSRLAWNSRIYQDFDAYKRAQRNWMLGGVVLCLILVASYGYVIYAILSMI